LKQLTATAARIAETAPVFGTKSLADALYAQMGVVEAALRANFALPVRDFYDRTLRDGTAGTRGGWGAFS
jgi:hypothetical protein